MKRAIFSLMVVAAVLMCSAVNCNNNPIDPDPEPVTLTYGVYFLHSGHVDMEDAEITQLNTLYATVNKNVFSAVNEGKKLGSNASEIFLLGNKMYVSVTGSKRISVINKYSCQEVASIGVVSPDGKTLSPRAMDAYEGKLLVSFDEGYVASIDTVSYKASLQEVGAKVYDIAVAGQKLYVATSQKLIEYNPVTLDEMNTLPFTPRLKQLMADDLFGGLFILCNDGEDRLYRVNTSTDEAALVPSVVRPTRMERTKNGLLLYTADTSDDIGGRFQILNLETLSLTGFISDGSFVKDPCGIYVDPNTQNVYIAQNDANAGGCIYIYTTQGQYVTSFFTNSYNPCSTVFVTD